MNSEMLHDALNMIDDDMLDEVYNLRCRKKKYRFITNIISAAACVCLILICVSLPHLFNSTDYVGDTLSDSASQNTYGTYADGADYDTFGDIGAAKEYPTLIVEIEKWQDNGFTAKIYKTVDYENLEIGENIEVKFNGDILVKETDENGYSYEKRMPTRKEFPNGSIAEIEVTRFADNIVYTSMIGKCEGS